MARKNKGLMPVVYAVAIFAALFIAIFLIGKVVEKISEWWDSHTKKAVADKSKKQA